MQQNVFLINLFVVTISLILAFSGCSPSIDDKDPIVRIEAIENISDQAILAKVVLEDIDYDVRNAAFQKLTDQTFLAKVALESPLFFRWEAVEKLADQALLAKLAFEDKDERVRSAAILKLSDPELLARAILLERNGNVRSEIIEKFADPSGRSKLAPLADPIARLKVINELKDSDPFLIWIAGNIDEPTQDAREGIARLKLIIQEPTIKSHFPQLQCVAVVSEIRQWYMEGGDKPGEHVTFIMNQDKQTFAEASWETQFPVFSELPLSFKAATVNLEDLLNDFFHQAVFTQGDLAKLFHSKFIEVRLSAVANMSDQVQLTEIAKNDKRDSMKQAALKKLTDQKVLAYIASNDESRAVRHMARVCLIADQDKLADMAKNDNDLDSNAREFAVEKLTDPAFLTELVNDLTYSNVRNVAEKRLKALKKRKTRL